MFIKLQHIPANAIYDHFSAQSTHNILTNGIYDHVNEESTDDISANAISNILFNFSSLPRLQKNLRSFTLFTLFILIHLSTLQINYSDILNTNSYQIQCFLVYYLKQYCAMFIMRLQILTYTIPQKKFILFQSKYKNSLYLTFLSLVARKKRVYFSYTNYRRVNKRTHITKF